LLRRAAFIAALALLAGCASWTTGDTSVGTDTVDTTTAGTASVKTASISASKPFDAYVTMGGHIKSCWFNADAPLLPKYVYRADVSPDSTKVKITIHDRAELGRAGMSTYAIDFKQAGPSTVITTENRKMPPNLAAKMQYDIDRWKRGESDCNKTMPPVPADTTAAVPPPKPGPAKPGTAPKSAAAQKPAAH
jgi:hypothetical protein